ncbi:hypothetical protein [Paenibacillus naphthalenovorans]|uniref:hypothetical protein n=1 Tax=Paenibacillus naphthalenovorans TaxID=162209 RepID=UPI003D26E1FD
MPTKNKKTFIADLIGDLQYTDISTARKIQTPIREKKFLKSNVSRKYGNKLLAVSSSNFEIMPEIIPAINIKVEYKNFLDSDIFIGLRISFKKSFIYTLPNINNHYSHLSANGY